MPSVDYGSVFFWGQVFLPPQLNQKPLPASLSPGLRSDIIPALPDTRAYLSTATNHIKPHLSSGFGFEKAIFAGMKVPDYFIPNKREQAIVFHPLLPYNFNLYFRDRQIAHVELAFNIISSGERNSIVVKRKISSGNLEVDLLTMRYIEYYLFIQQSRFPLNKWQIARIDLSAKND
ncbi:MAG TPA: hypothetical protein VMD04_00950 [Candidatus Margulisiibacteriota bacterium]|nr:hypothetical protein [Candidatus Margulisiibacteriota bacterium]